MKNLKFRMWDYENSTFEHNLSISDCSCDGNVEYQSFTGFHDSKNKEIYEGDIVRWEEYQGREDGRTLEGIYVVLWDEGRGQWMLRDPYVGDTYEMYDTKYDCVIGNILENKALLPCEGGIQSYQTNDC